MTEAFFTDKSKVRASFERAAAQYDTAAILQREVAQRMASRLDYIKVSPAMILDAGSGTGDSLSDLQRRYPDARIIELDLAYNMLRQSRSKQGMQWVRRLLGRHGPSQICGDIEKLPIADASVDLVWSNLAIQWVNIPDLAFAEFRRVLKADGLLMFSTFGPDTLYELKQSFVQWDTATHVNQFIDMHDLGDALLKYGFTEPVMDMDKIIMTYETVRAVVKDLKTIGAHNVTLGRRRGLLGKETWHRVETAYEAYRRQSKLPATYEVVYGHAWCSALRSPSPMRSDGSQVIEFVPSRSKRR